MHFNKSKDYLEKLDMDHLSNMYQILNTFIMNGYMSRKRQKEKEKKRDNDEASYMQSMPMKCKLIE